MTPKEKAKNLVLDFNNYTVIESIYTANGKIKEGYTYAKKCALRAIDEIAKCTKYENQKFENDRFSENYWDLVKREIELL
jgi:hypothetical protein